MESRALLLLIAIWVTAAFKIMEERLPDFCDPASVEKSEKPYAYVLFAADPSDPTRRDFFISALLSALSIKAFSNTTNADIVLMVLGDLDFEDSALINAIGMKLKRIGPIGVPVPRDHAKEDNRTLEIYRAHVRAAQLAEYEMIISLDSDILNTADMSHFFDLPGFTIRQGYIAPVNTGFYIFPPSCEDFNIINEVASSGEWTPERGWKDFGPFPDWRDASKDTDWTFHSSSSDQGMIFYYYVCLQKKYPVTIYPLRSGIFEEYMIHFIGKHKPWLFPRDELDDMDDKWRDGMKMWYRLLDDLREVAAMNDIDVDLSLPIERNAAKKDKNDDDDDEDSTTTNPHTADNDNEGAGGGAAN